MARIHRYKSIYGEGYVLVQFLLWLLVIVGPRGSDGWRFPPTMFGTGAGILLILSGAVLARMAKRHLGANFTMVPRPKDSSSLTTTGPYRYMRHPLYSAAVLVCVGWGLIAHSWLTLIYATCMFIFVDIKARREERWLTEKFPEYSAYQKRVRKLIPFVY